jgi:hypothetical protein
MNMDIEEKVGVEGEHVKKVVEDSAEDGHPRIHHEKEGQHLQRAPQRLWTQSKTLKHLQLGCPTEKKYPAPAETSAAHCSLYGVCKM